MKIETKYKIGQYIHFLIDNIVYERCITKIYIEINKEITKIYYSVNDACIASLEEERVFQNENDIMHHLFDNINKKD